MRALQDFVKASRRLSDLHLDYESVEMYPLTITERDAVSLCVMRVRRAKQRRIVNKTTKP